MNAASLGPLWEGHNAQPLDPATLRFKAEPALVHGECDGCVFCGQRAAVCRQVEAIAAANNIIDCDGRLPDGSSVIYVIDKSDPRQMDLLQGVK
jgi:hypothetical protein